MNKRISHKYTVQSVHNKLPTVLANPQRTVTSWLLQRSKQQEKRQEKKKKKELQQH